MEPNKTQKFFYTYSNPTGLAPSEEIINSHKGFIFDEKNQVIYANGKPYGANKLPSGGSEGQILSKSEDGYKWIDQENVLLASSFSDDFETALREALVYAKNNNYNVVDTTNFTGKHICKERFVIDFPVTVLLGDVQVTMQDSVFFNIKSNNVQILGLNRASDNTQLSDTNSTELILKGISQNPTEGYHIYSRGCKNCKYSGMTLTGIRSSIESQEGSTSSPINGTGGIFIEKANPGTTGAGNTCNNTIIDNILINGSKAAGIYIDTPIVSEIRNVRISSAGGHGIYISGGTSLMIESCYVSSANYAGFCLQSLTYCTVINSVAETCGCGWWIRSCSNISLFSPGTESTTILKNNPWSTQYNETKRYGKGLTTTSSSGATVKISDVPDDAWEIGGKKIYARGLFIGYGFVITGGKYINIYTPYVTTISQQNPPSQGGTLADILTNLAYLTILGEARNVTIVNFGAKENSSSNLPKQLYREISISKDVDGLDLMYNPNEAIIPSYTNLITNDWNERSPIYNESLNANIHSGNVFFTKMNMPGVISEDSLNNKLSNYQTKLPSSNKNGDVLSIGEDGNLEWKTIEIPEANACDELTEDDIKEIFE